MVVVGGTVLVDLGEVGIGEDHPLRPRKASTTWARQPLLMQVVVVELDQDLASGELTGGPFRPPPGL